MSDQRSGADAVGSDQSLRAAAELLIKAPNHQPLRSAFPTLPPLEATLDKSIY